MRPLVVLVAALSALLPACKPEPKLRVVVSVRRSAAFPVLSTFAKETAANLDMRFLSRKDDPGDEFDVLWSADPEVVFERRDRGLLGELSAAARATRSGRMVDPDGLWAAVTADLRVFAYDPKRIDESEVPTRFEELLDPQTAPRVAIATPLSRSASWHYAALFASKGAAPTTAFVRDLRAGGASFTESERAVLEAVSGDGPPIGVLDGEVAFSGRELKRRLAVLIPDQDSGGAILRATTLAVHKDAAVNRRAIELTEYLLSPPVGRRLALMSSHIALLPEGEPSAGALTLRDLEAAPISQPEIARQLSSVRRSLENLR